MAISKVIYKPSASAQGVTWIDATPATAAAADIISPKTAMLANGVVTQGTGSGGITPTGNINISQAGVTDVTNYATATVPSATPSYIGCSTRFFTENNVRKWEYTPRVEVDPLDGGNAGWLGEGEIYGNPATRNAIATNTTITPSTSSQTIGDRDYMLEGPITVAAMPSGTAGTPTATKGTVSNHSVTITPSVTNTTGYITGSTKTGTAVTVSASELVSGNKEITANGTNIDVADYSTVSVSVPSSGSSKNVQVAQSTTRVANTAYTKTASLTCAVTGKYDVYWDCFRSTTSGTSGSQLYIGGSAYGSANTTFSNHAQNNHLTNVSITAGQEVSVYVRSRATNYYAYCGQLTIVQTS